MLKKILLSLLFILILIQFVRPARNEGDDQTNAINKIYPVPEDLNKILAVACYDCHSNKTRYPWYNTIQPVAWYLNNHVIDGKRHLNFSDFTKRRIAIQNKKFEEIIDMIDKDKMPLSSYTLIHSDARLNDDQKQSITSWAQTQMDALKARYPADSLIMPKRPGGPPPGK
jgi:Haem-binding domain